MLKKKSIIDPISELEVRLYLASPEEFCEYINKGAEEGVVMYDEASIERIKRMAGSVDSLETKNDYFFTFWINSDGFKFTPPHYALLAHECFHLTERIASSINPDESHFKDDNKEYFAYHLERLYTLILTELIKMKKRRKK